MIKIPEWPSRRKLSEEARLGSSQTRSVEDSTGTESTLEGQSKGSVASMSVVGLRGPVGSPAWSVRAVRASSFVSPPLGS